MNELPNVADYLAIFVPIGQRARLATEATSSLLKNLTINISVNGEKFILFNILSH